MADDNRKKAQFDSLTGLLDRASFFEKVTAMVSEQEAGYYVMACFDVDNFKVINDQYGSEKGDEALKFIATTFKDEFRKYGGLCCRIMADQFAALYPSSLMELNKLDKISHKAAFLDEMLPPITFSIGRYIIDDKSLSASAMYDRAALAEESIKGRYDVHVALYEESMRKKLLREQEIISEMDTALANRHFEVWFQPQYNHATGALIGAEALVRWRHPEKGLISPGEFIPVFERNGFIYELDKYVWEETCHYLRKWIDEGRNPLPASVNISRNDIYRDDLIDVIHNLIDKYNIPIDLLRLEITESAFSKSVDQIIRVVKHFVEAGFIVEIDDFGSGYSSLNTLKDVPAQVVKLDMKFLEGEDNSTRGGNIIESIVRMTKWLGVAVIAEGVETSEQADYLKSIGCTYIQGYFYARPMPAEEYEKAARNISKESKMIVLETVDSLDNNIFWDPKSLETLIFNTYIGSACILEYNKGSVELIRANDKFTEMFHSEELTLDAAIELCWPEHMDYESRQTVHASIKKAKETNDEVTDIYNFINLPGCPGNTYLRSTLRIIATAGDRYLLYCMSENITAQLNAEQRKAELSEQLHMIMDNITGGVTAVTLSDNSKISFIYANDHYFEMLGYTREQFKDEVQTPFSIVHPDDRQHVIETTAKGNLSHHSFSCIYRAIRRDNTIIWIQSNISITFIEGIEQPVQIAVANDITAQREAELNEQKTAERMQAIMENVESGITATVINNGNIQFLFANDKYYEIHGYTKQQYTTEVSNSFDLIRPDERYYVQAVAEDVLRSGQSKTIEYHVSQRDGNEICLRVVLSSAMFNDFDSPVQLAVCRDITEEKFAQDKLKETDEQLRFLNEISHDLLSETDCNVGIEKVLHKLLIYFHGSRAYIFEFDKKNNLANNTYEVCAEGVCSEKDELQDVPMGTLSIWIDAFHNQNYVCIDNVSSMDKNRSLKSQIFLEQGIERLIAVPLRRNGNLIGFIGIDEPSHQQLLVNRLDALGDYIAVMLTRRDLNAKIKSDHLALKNMMNDTPGGFTRILISEDGGISKSYVNEGYCNLLGMTYEEVMQHDALDPLDHVHPDDIAFVHQTIERSLINGGVQKVKYRLRHKNGEYKWFHVFGRTTKNRNGQTFINTYYNEITDEEKNELAFHDNILLVADTIMESTNAPSFSKDRNFVYTCCNSAFVEFTHKFSKNDILGKTDYELFDKQTADKFRRDDIRLLREKTPIIDMIEAVPSKDGKAVSQAKTSKYPLYDDTGNIIGLYGKGQYID